MAYQEFIMDDFFYGWVYCRHIVETIIPLDIERMIKMNEHFDKLLEKQEVKIDDYYFYAFHWIDDLSYIIKPAAIPQLEKIKELFLSVGWEGDGDIGLIWLPPFVDMVDDGVTIGAMVWHVKQENNGTSFLACRQRLTSKHLSS